MMDRKKRKQNSNLIAIVYVQGCLFNINFPGSIFFFSSLYQKNYIHNYVKECDDGIHYLYVIYLKEIALYCQVYYIFTIKQLTLYQPENK
jgi:hypothetical protein